MKILISYRRADSEVIAGRIRDRLVGHYGNDSVFMDVDDIPVGKDFRKHIMEALARSDILIAIVGPRWLGAVKRGSARIDADTDPVRIEIETAQRNGTPIIPVLVGKTTMPTAAQLPNTMKDFAFINAAHVDTGRDFHRCVERIIRSVDEIIKDKNALPSSIAGELTAGAPLRLTLPDKPSIAVMPFQNISGDPEQEYFADGISEDIITALSKMPKLFVIARNSSFTFKGKAVHIPEVSKKLGVQYVLEGSVRKSGKRVRITAQLIDGTRGGHLWAERYDRDLTDIFEVQDDVTQHIVSALNVTLSEAERSLIVDGGTKDVEAHDLFLKGRAFLFGPKRDREMFEQSMSCFRRAIELDPNYAGAYAGLGLGFALDHHNRWSDAPETSLDQAQRFVDEAIAKDDKDSFPHFVAAVVATWKKDFERWVYESDRALSLNPNYALALGNRGLLHICTGEPAKAVPYIERAMRLDPAGQHGQWVHFLGTAHFVAGEYELAAACFKDRMTINARTDLSRAFLACALGHLGKVDEARRIWRELEEINPRYSFADHIGRLPFRSPADAEKFADGLRRAGLIDQSRTSRSK